MAKTGLSAAPDEVSPRVCGAFLAFAEGTDNFDKARNEIDRIRMNHDACGPRQAIPHYRYVTEITSCFSFCADTTETARFFIAYLELFRFKSMSCPA